MLARVAVHRGATPSEAEVRAILDLARPIDELQALSPALVVAALAACVRGDAAAAGGFLEEFTEVTRDAATGMADVAARRDRPPGALGRDGTTWWRT